MNKKLFWTLFLALITSLSMQAQDDDLYFTPSKKKKGQNMNATVTSVRSNQQSVSTTNTRPTLAVYNNNSRDEDEYNRRDANYAGAWQTDGGAQDSLIGSVDTVYEVSPDMYDPESDFVYSRRLLRFHSPRFGFALSSPYYWDLVYGYGVYNYLYDPFYWDLYDPFYWDYGWGYGWSWRPWYSTFYGWHSPYYAWDYWGVGPYWHGVGHFDSNRFSNSRNRGTFSESRYGNGSISRTSAVAAANGSRNSFSSRTENTLRTSAVRSNTATRSSANGSSNRISTSGNTRTVFNGNTVSGNANNRVVVVNRNDNSNRTSAVRQNTQTTRTQTQTNATTQRVTTPTTTQQRTSAAQTQQRTTVSMPQRSSATSSSSSFSSGGGSTRGSFGGGGSVGGGASSGGSRTSAGRR